MTFHLWFVLAIGTEMALMGGLIGYFICDRQATKAFTKMKKLFLKQVDMTLHQMQMNLELREKIINMENTMPLVSPLQIKKIP